MNTCILLGIILLIMLVLLVSTYNTKQSFDIFIKPYSGAPKPWSSVGPLDLDYSKWKDGDLGRVALVYQKAYTRSHIKNLV
jgi:hypothetical protein